MDRDDDDDDDDNGGRITKEMQSTKNDTKKCVANKQLCTSSVR
jgi:hypothetical protein